MTLFTTFMMGTYVVMWKGQEKIDKPALDPTFDINSFTGPWYMIMMSNDLPWFTEQCGQSEFEIMSDGTYYYRNRWYDIDTAESSDMDRPMTCSIYRPADCRFEIIWEAY